MIEMLVVILIIGVLIALLMPAVNAARESARATQCINNQQELGKALISYDIKKNRLPGVLSLVNPSAPATSPRLNWVMSIFDEMGRMDLWQYWQGGPLDASNNPKIPVKVSQLICPNNPTINPVGGLSYFVNLGEYQIASGDPVYAGRLFRNRAAWNPSATPPLLQDEEDQTLTAAKSSTRAVMLSERAEAGQWSWLPATHATVPYTPGVYSTDLARIAFQWPLVPTTIRSFLGDPLVPGTRGPHHGNFIMTFCDGHSEKIPEATLSALDPDNPIYGTP